MRQLKGLYIEDDPSNVTVLQARLEKFNDICIEGLEEFPQKPGEFYELDKQKVLYKGSDALREIRKQDNTIYAILLTNYTLEEYKDELGAYDFQLTKKEMKDPGKVNEIVQKVRRACELRCDNKVLAEMEQRNREKEELIKELKQITGMD